MKAANASPWERRRLAGKLQPRDRFSPTRRWRSRGAGNVVFIAEEEGSFLATFGRAFAKHIAQSEF
jgi:hypothetical protein